MSTTVALPQCSACQRPLVLSAEVGGYICPSCGHEEPAPHDLLRHLQARRCQGCGAQNALPTADGRVLCAVCHHGGGRQAAPRAIPEAPTATPQVALGDLLDNVVAFVRKFVVLSPAQADAVALWVAHTHAFSAAQATPYLAITSPEKRSGKTRLLEVLSLLVARAWYTARVSAAVLVRKIDRNSPTLLLDETDAAFGGEREYAEVLRSILNSGWRSGGAASLCVRQGQDWVLRDFPVFGPKAIAGMGKLPDTVANRSILIAMRRRAPDEEIARFRWRDAKAEAQPLQDGLMAWAAGAIDRLSDARPEIPGALSDRACEGWEPLLAIAELAGGDWPRRARDAALALSAKDAEDESLGVRLLADIRRVFEEQQGDRIPSKVLAQALCQLEESPWGDLRGRPLDARKLASLLAPFNIFPKTVRIPQGGTQKGYLREDFDDAFLRYLPSISPYPRPLTVTPSHPVSETDKLNNGNRNIEGDVTASQEGLSPFPTEDVTLVTDKKPHTHVRSVSALRDDICGRNESVQEEAPQRPPGGHLLRAAVEAGGVPMEGPGAEDVRQRWEEV